MPRLEDEGLPETSDKDLSRREMLARLKVAAYLVPGLGAVVATVGSHGCTPAQTPTTATQSPTATVGPSPTVAPTVAPTPSPAAWDGTYGPGLFTRGTDTCNPPFFGGSYNGTLIISQSGTRCSIGESQTRQSVGSITNDNGVFTGQGNVGSRAATWRVEVRFTQSGTTRIANVTENITLDTCGAPFTSVPLQRVGNAPIQS